MSLHPPELKLTYLSASPNFMMFTAVQVHDVFLLKPHHLGSSQCGTKFRPPPPFIHTVFPSLALLELPSETTAWLDLVCDI